MFCPLCRKGVSEESKFCVECGMSLEPSFAVAAPGAASKAAGQQKPGLSPSREREPAEGSASKDCPNCDLTNLSSATRCDCGFDFVSLTIQGPYEAKAVIRGHLIWMAIFLVGVLIQDLTLPGREIRVLCTSIYAVVALGLHRALWRRSNRARVVLMILTIPLGLALSRPSVKRYCKNYSGVLPAADPRSS